MAARPFSRMRPGSSASISSRSSNIECIGRMLDLTKCFYCLQQLKEARMLPCHHSFCTQCIFNMMNSSSTKTEFLCPIDREVITIPQYGINSFELDYRARELTEIRTELEESTYVNDEVDTSVADIDINLESLNKGVKDIEHSSAMSQHAVNMLFENVYKKLKRKQEKLIKQIKAKSENQVTNLEFEKYRLIEAKKFQNEQFNDSFFCEEDLIEPFTENKSITTSTPPSPNSLLSKVPNFKKTNACLSLLSCNIGQQHLEFTPNEATLSKLEEQFDHLGDVTCDFDLKVKLQRNLLSFDNISFGMKIGGNENSDWTTAQPKGLSRRLGSQVVVANSGRNELVVLDNSFNTKLIISGDKKFQSISDVTTYGNNIFVADAGASQVVMLSSDGTIVKRFGKAGAGNMELQRPNGITTDSRGRIIVSDSLNHRVKVLSPDLTKCVFTLHGDKKRTRESLKFSFPCGVAVDGNDSIYVTDTNNKRVVIFTREGKFSKEIFPCEFHDPRCVAVSSDNKLLITDRENSKLLICDHNGQYVTEISGIVDPLGRESRFKQPYGVVVDGTDKIVVTDIELNALFVL